MLHRFSCCCQLWCQTPWLLTIVYTMQLVCPHCCFSSCSVVYRRTINCLYVWLGCTLGRIEKMLIPIMLLRRRKLNTVKIKRANISYANKKNATWKFPVYGITRHCTFVDCIHLHSIRHPRLLCWINHHELRSWVEVNSSQKPDNITSYTTCSTISVFQRWW